MDTFIFWLSVGAALLIHFSWKHYWSPPSRVRNAWFLPNGEIVTINSKNTAQSIDCETGVRIGVPKKRGWMRRAPDAVFSPDGLHVAYHDNHGRITAREWQTGKKIRQFKTPDNSSWVTFSADGTLLACGGIHKPVYI